MKGRGGAQQHGPNEAGQIFALPETHHGGRRTRHDGPGAAFLSLRQENGAEAVCVAHVCARACGGVRGEPRAQRLLGVRWQQLSLARALLRETLCRRAGRQEEARCALAVPASTDTRTRRRTVGAARPSQSCPHTWGADDEQGGTGDRCSGQAGQRGICGTLAERAPTPTPTPEASVAAKGFRPCKMLTVLLRAVSHTQRKPACAHLRY